ncbi:MAG: signal peptide peptidase SppA [Verrucomicrobiae bacterium]|nr:signal peptide peptidase SppA [Verrucomicrobiae bacterium]
MSSELPPPPPTLEEQLWRTNQTAASRKRRLRWLWLFLGLSILLNLWFFLMVQLQQQSSVHNRGAVFIEQFYSGDEDSPNKIAVIRIEGLISSEVGGHTGMDGMVGDICEQIDLAGRDEQVKAVIVRVDSPGGEVLAADRLYRALCKLRERKPVLCSMGSVAASGGYYAAIGSRWVVADDLSITGSIGVIMETLNYKDLLGKIGVRTIVFKSGKFKDIMNGAREPTPEEMDLMQNLIMEAYEQFLQLVAKERKLNPEQLRNGVADGRILSGKQALAAKLIDQTGTFEDTIEKAKKDAAISHARVIEYQIPFTWRNLFALLLKSPPTKIQVDLPGNPMAGLKIGKLYFLSAHLF